MACLGVALAACASQSRSVTSASLETETQRQTAALASETAAEIDKCVANIVAQQPPNPKTEPGAIADAALSQCTFWLSEYQSNDGALVLATDPNDSASFADQHARRSKADMTQAARRRAIAIVQEQQARLAQQ